MYSSAKETWILGEYTALGAGIHSTIIILIQQHALQHNNNNNKYHVRVERRRELLSIQIIPVNGGEEHVVLDLIL